MLLPSVRSSPSRFFYLWTEHGVLFYSRLVPKFPTGDIFLIPVPFFFFDHQVFATPPSLPFSPYLDLSTPDSGDLHFLSSGNYGPTFSPNQMEISISVGDSVPGDRPFPFPFLDL